MREIEYRGKRCDNGEWVHGMLFQISESLNPFIMLKNHFGTSYEVYPETVGEFTGLRDSERTKEHPEGQKIYEGDIIQIEEFYVDTSEPLPDILNVRFYEGMFQLFRKSQSLMGLHLGRIKKGKVIGNTSDNPDLLKAVFEREGDAK